ncbi:MAG: CBS domain-containing protein [Deltaproteobacteria bacterium]|nr:CBS domain-containing protein [Deltaproteobacteria bacterium]
MSKTVGEILKTKTKELSTITPDKTVQDAVNLLVEKRIGSLVVVKENQELAGIITERDVLRECAKHPNKLGEVKIQDVMSKEVIVGRVEDTVQFVKHTMITRRIRHLPIVEGNKVTQMLSIGDVVKSLLEDSTQEADDLRDRLAGHYVVA